MDPTGKKFLSLFLVFSLMMLSINLYAKERRGAKLLITNMDGHQVEGELITVKPNSLLLLDTEGKDVSVDVEEIKVIRIVNKSKAGVGFLLGGCLGALIGLVGYEDTGTADDLFYISQGASVRFGAIFFALIGGIAGLASGTDETIQIEGNSDKKIREALDKLRKKARVRDYK